MKDRLYKLPDDPITCLLEELTAPLSAECISRQSFSLGGNILDPATELRKQRQSNKVFGVVKKRKRNMR